MTKEAVIVISNSPWDFHCDYAKQISLELVKRSKVVVCRPLILPTLKNLFFDKKTRREWLSFFKEKRITYFPALAILPFQRFKLIKEANIRLNAVFFRLFYHFKFKLEKPIFWVFSYDLGKFVNYFKWGKLLVYDRVDQVASTDPRLDQEMKRKERFLLKAADFVFVNSPYSLRCVRKYKKQSFLAPWGCAGSLFFSRPVKLPTVIKKIKKPIIGFVSSINHRLDFKLICLLVTKRRDWSFVFVGPISNCSSKRSGVAGLDQWLVTMKKLSNVHFLGRRSKKKMADFIASFDVCLIPYDVSQEFAKGCNPMKLYEYLAMGKPVVSTPIEAVKRHSPTVKIAKDALDFEKAVEKLLKEGYNGKEAEKRQRIALENSWENRVDLIWGMISRKNEK